MFHSFKVSEFIENIKLNAYSSLSHSHEVTNSCKYSLLRLCDRHFSPLYVFLCGYVFINIQVHIFSSFVGSSIILTDSSCLLAVKVSIYQNFQLSFYVSCGTITEYPRGISKCIAYNVSWIQNYLIWPISHRRKQTRYFVSFFSVYIFYDGLPYFLVI